MQPNSEPALSPSQESTRGASSAPAQPDRILVVDDDDHNLALIALQLRAAGYEVSSVSDGHQAVRIFAQAPADLVLLDVMMPGLDGFEVCRQLRALSGGGETAIVFLTALSDGSAHERALSSGGDDFLTKPFQRTELLMRVRSLLRIKRLQDEQRRNYRLIRAQRDQLVAARRAREAAMSFVVHDLKNPLATILLSADLLSSTKNLDALQLECSRDIVRASRRMNRMVLNLLDLSRSEDGALVPNREPIDLQQLALELSAEVGPVFAAKQQRFTPRPCPGVRTLHADRELLGRMLVNLLDNASKFAPASSAIVFEAELLEDGTTELRVRDCGPGVNAADRQRIFERYVSTAHEGYAGGSFGLGLSSCRVIAEAHGGSIRVEDNTPEGAMFCVRLPKFR